MKKIYRNGLFMLVAGMLAASCADYNVTDDFKAEPDPTFKEPYKDLQPVKSYIDREKYPNLTLGATLAVSDFNKQELAHAAAITNFDNLAFGTSLMSGNIVSGKGVMNFLELKDLLDHVEEIGGEVFGSPIVANANQADAWLKNLTAPIEIPVEYVEGNVVDYTQMTKFEGTIDKGKPVIAKYDGANALKVPASAVLNIIEDFEVDSLATYTTTFWAKSAKEATFTLIFSGDTVDAATASKKWIIQPGKWSKIVVEAKANPSVKNGYLKLANTRATELYIQKAQVGYYPDNHRPQTEKELNDTVHYALNAWCDGLMKINQGRITSFDLIDEPLGTKKLDENSYLDLKHSTSTIYWQDIFGSENYAPTVAKAASEAFEKRGGDPSKLKFFISEVNLEKEDKFESLKYWIDIWEKNGAKIDGINAKLSLTYSEDATKQAANKATLDNLLSNLSKTGKLIRLSNFDIKYQDATGKDVSSDNITDEQRQKLADYYAYVIKSYMTVIPSDKQAGLCKGNMADTSSSPVGLWSVHYKTKDWVRTATYKAFCDALSGK